MLKFYIGYSEAKNAHLIGIGLATSTIQGLQNKNVFSVFSKELNVPGREYGILLFHVEDEADVRRKLDNMFPELSETTTIARTDDKCYVSFIVNDNNDRALVLIFLTDKGIAILQEDSVLSFRARNKKNGVAYDSMEILLFYTSSMEKTMKFFREQGYIGPDTKVVDHTKKKDLN